MSTWHLRESEDDYSLYSPAMQKWLRSSKKRGVSINFAKDPFFRRRWEGAGIPQNLDRYTDDGGLRILDSPIGIFNTAQPRTIDYPSGITGPTPALMVASAAGIHDQKIKIGGQTIIRFGKDRTLRIGG